MAGLSSNFLPNPDEINLGKGWPGPHALEKAAKVFDIASSHCMVSQSIAAATSHCTYCRFAAHRDTVTSECIHRTIVHRS